METIRKIRPLFDRVFVKPAEKKTKTSAGIIIPETGREGLLEGRVVAVGPGKKDEPMTVKVGDHVMFRSGREIEIEEVNYLIMRQEDIYAIIQG